MNFLTRVVVPLFIVLGAGGCYHSNVLTQSTYAPTYAPTYVTQQTTATSITVSPPTATPLAPTPDDAVTPTSSEGEDTQWRPAVRLLTPMSLGYSPVDLNQCIRVPCQNRFGGCRCVYPGQPIPRANDQLAGVAY